MFQSLHQRNYRLYFIGQLISLCGTWAQVIAQGWLVLELSDDSGVALGLVTACQYGPTLLFSLWGGVLADRADKRRVLIVTQAVMAVSAGGLAAVTILDVAELWMVYVLVGLSGLGSAADQPARLSFVPEMVGDDDLPNALALNSALFNGARLIGPTIAGFVIVVFGTGACFLLNAVSYVAVITAFTRMRPHELHRGDPVPRGKGQIRAGLHYVWSTPQLRANIVMMALIGTLALNFPVVLPLLAKVTFDGDAGTYSAMTACMGGGALVGALALASRSRTNGRRVVVAAIAFGVMMAVAALAPSLPLLFVVLGFVGITQMITLSSSNALVQLDATPAMRGRVSALRSLTVIGSTPIGGVIAGWVSEAQGPRWAIAMGAASCAVAVALGGRAMLAGKHTADVAVLDPTLTEPAVAATS